MAFFTGTTSNTALDQPHYRDLLVRLVAAATSKNIATPGAFSVNAGGAGYTTGDILEIRHASEPSTTANTMPCRVVITAAAGAVTGVSRVISAGAFSNRITSAVVNAGGSNYAVGDILQVQGGTYTRRAKFKVATLSGSAVATVTQFEDGGAYSSLPGTTGATTVKVGPAAGTGSGCTLNLTTQAIIGTTNIATTVITGGGNGAATFDITLTGAEWKAVRDNNNFSTNSVTDEMEVVLQGTVSGGDEPFCGFRTYTTGTNPNTRYGWCLVGMDDYNDGLPISGQANVGPNDGSIANGGVFLLTFDAAELFWFAVTGRRLVVKRKAQGGSLLTYQGCHHGLGNPYGTASESPYPFYVAGSCGAPATAPDAGGAVVTGLTELLVASNSPAYFRHPGTGAWTQVQNSNFTTYTRIHTLYPLGTPDYADASTSNEDFIAHDSSQVLGTANGYCFFDTGALEPSKANGGAANILIMPHYGTDESFLVPTTVISTPSNADGNTDCTPRLEMDGVFWVSATKADGNVMTSEDTITVGSQKYLVFQNAGRTERYSFMAIKEA